MPTFQAIERRSVNRLFVLHLRSFPGVSVGAFSYLYMTTSAEREEEACNNLAGLPRIKQNFALLIFIKDLTPYQGCFSFINYLHRCLLCLTKSLSVIPVVEEEQLLILLLTFSLLHTPLYIAHTPSHRASCRCLLQKYCMLWLLSKFWSLPSGDLAQPWFFLKLDRFLIQSLVNQFNQPPSAGAHGRPSGSHWEYEGIGVSFQSDVKAEKHKH